MHAEKALTFFLLLALAAGAYLLFAPRKLSQAQQGAVEMPGGRVALQISFAGGRYSLEFPSIVVQYGF